MKTFAVTTDEGTMHLLDQLRHLRGGTVRRRSRSALVREAVRDLAQRELRRGGEAREAEIFRHNSAKLARQTAVLIREQAKP